jgi:hypothetical protein
VIRVWAHESPERAARRIETVVEKRREKHRHLSRTRREVVALADLVLRETMVTGTSREAWSAQPRKVATPGPRSLAQRKRAGDGKGPSQGKAT